MVHVALSSFPQQPMCGLCGISENRMEMATESSSCWTQFEIVPDFDEDVQFEQEGIQQGSGNQNRDLSGVIARHGGSKSKES